MLKFKVEIKKTVQVKQYEPTTITLSVEDEVPTEDYIEKRDAVYNELKAKMNEIFGNKSSCLD